MKSFNVILTESEFAVIRMLLMKAPAALEMTLPVLQSLDSQVSKQINPPEDGKKKK